MASAATCSFRQEITRKEQDFVTVVSVGNNQRPVNVDNFVTVLSIGTVDKNDSLQTDASTSGSVINNLDVHPEEEVEVFRLPGEPLGFGLKFEGGAKNAERVKRLFVQSCAEQSPASRAKCSWSAIGEGDEVLSIDGVPVTQMSRLDCVRRLKESQLVIKLLVRCRGALRPEVVSAELKTPCEGVMKCEKKIPPELPSVPPPVPPRKLRHARGSGDGEANPNPAKKTWNDSPTLSSSSSQTNSPQAKPNFQMVASPRNGKTTNEEFPSSKIPQGSPPESSKRTSNERSPEFIKSKQEPPEASVYLDARSQDSSSTHGSTSDDTGSSLSTVIDRFSLSDRFSTISTTSTTSGGTTEQNNSSDRHIDENLSEAIDYRDSTMLPTLEHLEQDFLTNPSEYLLKRLANSEAVTHVESRGEAGGVIEKITAVIAPNKIVIEETLTLQPPLSFQDAPLSYGHETRPGLIYTADLAADSTTHFRPIRDEASIVECVNGEASSSFENYEPIVSPVAPALPARNHVNRIPVNQTKDSTLSLDIDGDAHHSRQVPTSRESTDRGAPILPPKPLPRKDIKLKRKRPPPPPPPPRREPPPLIPDSERPEVPEASTTMSILKMSSVLPKDHEKTRLDRGSSSTNKGTRGIFEVDDNDDALTSDGENYDLSPLASPSKNDHDGAVKTNKVLEIIEMKKVKAFGELTGRISPTITNDEADGASVNSPTKNRNFIVPAPREKRKMLDKKREYTISMDIEDSEESNGSDIWQEAKEFQDSSENISYNSKPNEGIKRLNDDIHDDLSREKESTRSNSEKNNNGGDKDDDDEDETYRSLDEIREDFKSTDTNGTLSGSEEDEDEERVPGNTEEERDSTSDDSEENCDDYYWQSNLATIGEEEETSSLEYTNVNKDVNNSEEKSSCPRVESKIETTRGCTSEISEMMKNGLVGDVTKLESVKRISNNTVNTLDNKLESRVNGKMENCDGDQRLPPDGDEFPAMYQEFNACTSEQYQYVGTTTRLTSRSDNGAKQQSPENLARNEIDESSSTSLTKAIISGKYSKNFTEKTANESTKVLRIESTTKKNLINDNTDVIGNFLESREKTSSYGQSPANVKTSQIDNHSAGQYTTSSPKRDIGKKQEAPERENKFNEDAKRTSASYFNCSNATTKNPETPVVLTEKTFEISNYYTKDTLLINSEKKSRETKNSCDQRDITRETRNSIEKNDSDFPDSPPPPLPLTGPPKIEASVSSIGKNIEKLPEAIGNRKYSLNNDPRRQDDKSEKSVRDKIAMFSSQSSLESPLFPVQASIATTVSAITSNARKLSKYKSSDDVFNEEKNGDNKNEYGNIERTQSFVDLTDSDKFLFSEQTIKDNYQRPPSLPKTLPPDETTLSRISNNNKTTSQTTSVNNNITIADREFPTSVFNDASVKAMKTTSKTQNMAQRAIGNHDTSISSEPKIAYSTEFNYNKSRSGQPSLTRATSFSGESTFSSDLSQSGNSIISPNGQISRTNSLASTFRRNNEDMRRQSLNQLIEQRRKGISKLRGLVIPEKNSVAIDKPIIDLPEIKSRDSILLHQLPKASIQDKWGSQSSLASNGSTASLPVRATTSFKMPAPQIMSKYSPAFKRKSLTVYGTSPSNSSTTNAPTFTRRASPTHGYSATVADPPKSLESICSPTRSDYSFEFASSTSASPETMRNRSRTLQRKIRNDYDDSDNDSAVSSSQSSISRGFSPPTSPVPSERSSLSSERSYHTSLIMDVPARHYSFKETAIRPERMQHLTRPLLYDRSYSTSERSSSGSSSCSSPNARSPLPEVSLRNSQIPQRQLLKRSSSTETNCSSGSSSTLTSGSQASAESLSRRVLKPQSVEAINRKNILASARCRSGRDLNGSPLIQRKFSVDEELPISSLAQENGSCSHRNDETLDSIDGKDVKIAYIEITENCDKQEEQKNGQVRGKVKETMEISVSKVSDDCTDSELMEASNGLKMWIRSEAKALMADAPKARMEHAIRVQSTSESSSSARTTRARTSNNLTHIIADDRRKINVDNEVNNAISDNYRVHKSKSLTSAKETLVNTINEDLLTTLTTKSRSRTPINIEDRNFVRCSRQMSLEDILAGKQTDEKLSKSEIGSTIITSIMNDHKTTIGNMDKLPPAPLPRNNNNLRQSHGETAWTSEDKCYSTKIPTLDKSSKTIDTVDDYSSRLVEQRSRISKIPTQRSLGRRSASVTDMKKALERTDSIGGISSINPSNNSGIVEHHRFSSLDSNSEERIRTSETESERFNGEQFGSISSLASSTSLISQQELAQLVEDANGLEDSRGNHEVIVVLLHKENPHGSVGITLAGGVDCEIKEITVHRVLAHSIADKDGRVQRGDRILSINGRSTRGLTHRESLAVLKQPRSEIVLVVSRSRLEEGSRLRSRTESVETIVEGTEICGSLDETAWGPATRVTIFKDGAGLGFSLAGGRDSPLGDRPLVIKKIFTGGAAEKTASLTAGDQLIEVNGIDVTRMTRIEAWSLMKKLNDGEASLLVRHPAIKSS